VRRSKLSPVAAQLLHALVARIELANDRITIGRFDSVDWQSLTFIGERHEISLRLTGPDAAPALALLRIRLNDAEWQLGGHVVADILVVGDRASADGSILVEIEALTLSS